jgi:hypothetical protein
MYDLWYIRASEEEKADGGERVDLVGRLPYMSEM